MFIEAINKKRWKLPDGAPVMCAYAGGCTPEVDAVSKVPEFTADDLKYCKVLVIKNSTIANKGVVYKGKNTFTNCNIDVPEGSEFFNCNLENCNIKSTEKVIMTELLVFGKLTLNLYAPAAIWSVSIKPRSSVSIASRTPLWISSTTLSRDVCNFDIGSDCVFTFTGPSTGWYESDQSRIRTYTILAEDCSVTNIGFGDCYSTHKFNVVLHNAGNLSYKSNNIYWRNDSTEDKITVEKDAKLCIRKSFKGATDKIVAKRGSCCYVDLKHKTGVLYITRNSTGRYATTRKHERLIIDKQESKSSSW